MAEKKQFKIPVTILTGFLGSGKTTALNTILEIATDVKFAIIENEFGSINIDADLIKADKNGIIELPNGCICCSLNEELEKVINNLLNSNRQIDHLIIETTGLADPASVAAAFLSDYLINQRFQINGTICLVDAFHFDADFRKNQEVKRQIAFADLFILNKIDLCGSNIINNIRFQLNEINPFADILETSFAKIDVLKILTLNSYQNKNINLPSKFSKVSHSQFQSFSFHFKQPFDMFKINEWASLLLLHRQDDIYRVKGILNVKGQKEKIILQSVQRQTIFSFGLKWKWREKKESRVVIIGKNLNFAELEQSLQKCFF